MIRKQITKEVVDRILKLKKEGLPKTVIAQRMSMSRDSVFKILKKVEDEKGRDLPAH